MALSTFYKENSLLAKFYDFMKIHQLLKKYVGKTKTKFNFWHLVSPKLSTFGLR